MTIRLDGQRVLVLGLGVSGQSAAEFCARRGAQVVAADDRSAEELGELGPLPEGVELQLGSTPDPSDFDLVVPSPGVPPARYAGAARRVAGDIELAGQALQVPIVAVTGTNGKSTTVLMIEAMLRASGMRARAAGNLGVPALSLVGEPIDVAVLEVSSFQLETTSAFAPRVAVVLNVAPDHLDRHGDFDTYVAAKRRIVERQGADDSAVLNFGDPLVRAMANSTRARIIPFQRRPDGSLKAPAAWLDLRAAVLQSETQTLRIALDALPLAGAHNLENALAAITAVWALGADPQAASRALVGFRGLPHRCEVIATIDGVTYVDDSKATNTSAAQSALEGFDSPVVWIAGGRDKGLAYTELAQTAARRVRHAVLIGEAAPLLEDALAGSVGCERADSMREAVRGAARRAQPGDVVLLAPACASFDQFKSYEQRGDCFRKAVDALRGESAAE